MKHWKMKKREKTNGKMKNTKEGNKKDTEKKAW